MVRAPCFDQFGMKKGAWSEDEDNKLRGYIQRCGHRNWSQLPKLAGLSRCGKSCRLRWMNYLRPNVKHGNFTKEEEDVIVRIHNKLGNKWSMMAAQLPGRSDNEIKNHWHTYCKHQAQRDNANPKVSPVQKSNLKAQEEAISSSALAATSTRNESSSSCPFSDLDDAISRFATPPSSGYELGGDFWTDPFIPDNCSIYLGDTLSSPLGLVHDAISQASMMMDDEFLWSTHVDSYFHEFKSS